MNERGKGRYGEGISGAGGVMASSEGKESLGIADWVGGGGMQRDGERGREEVKKDTKARRESLNDKRSGQQGLRRQGPKGAAG